jgi:hypothetical protein
MAAQSAARPAVLMAKYKDVEEAEAPVSDATNPFSYAR